MPARLAPAGFSLRRAGRFAKIGATTPESLMTRSLTLILGALLALPGCQPDEPPVPDGVEICTASGGQLVQARSGSVCARPTDDAGAACTDGAQCQAGLCMAGTGCAALDHNFGCLDIVEDGQPVTLCID